MPSFTRIKYFTTSSLSEIIYLVCSYFHYCPQIVLEYVMFYISSGCDIKYFIECTIHKQTIDEGVAIKEWLDLKG
jgi:hypothetical protein